MNFQDKFRFCPACGAGPESFRQNDFKSKRCAHCGFTFYSNASSSVAVIILNERGDLLACRRAFAPAKGTLDLIGGFCDPGESLETAAVREVLEESSLQLNESSLEYVGSFPNVYLYSDFEIHTTDAIFIAHVPSTITPMPADDASEIIWIPSSDIPARIPEFGFASIRCALEFYINTKE